MRFATVKENVKFNKTANNFGSTYDIRELAASLNERERDDESHWMIHAVKRTSNTFIFLFSSYYLKRSLSKQTAIHFWA